MSKLGLWLEDHLDSLIQAAAGELATKEDMRSTVEDSISAFYSGLAYSADSDSAIPLHAILIDWIEARSAPTDEEPVGLLPIMVALKRVLWAEICRTAEPAEAIALLTEAENILTDAGNFLAKLEAEALLSDARRELTKIQTHVEWLDKTKSDFISVAAHELKTPLTIIEGYTSMLRSDPVTQQTSHLAMMAGGIVSGVTRLREILEDMIDVSLIDNRLLTLHFQPVWLHHVLEHVYFDLEEVLRQRKLTMTISPDVARLTYGDPERLHQVFRKVITNGVKYTPDGGKIVITARDLTGFTDVQVEDTGIGIAPENLPHIFDKFSSMADIATHSSGKTKFKGGGPGLGLAIARGIIEAHGGSIWVESPGYDEETLPGTTFHIMVPMRTAPPEDNLEELYKTKPKLKLKPLDGANG